VKWNEFEEQSGARGDDFIAVGKKLFLAIGRNNVLFGS
jgi:hypothetical protein